MSTPDSGIHKPFDRIVKSFNDEAPLILLEWIGLASPDAMPETHPLRAESSPPAVLPDVVLRVRPRAAAEFILHTEFELDYKATELPGLARQGGSLAFQYRIPVVSVMFLPSRDRAPASIPSVAEDCVGETKLTHPFRAVRAWELDPEPVLRLNQPRLMPWIVLLKSSDEQVAKVAEMLARLGDEEAIVRCLTLGGLRYDRKRLEEMLGGPKMGLAEAIVQGSSLFREARDEARTEGREEGREQGRQEGRLEGREEGRVYQSRRLLRNFLCSRHPGLELLPEVDSIQELPALEALVEGSVSPLATRAGIEHAIRSAAARTGSA